MYGQHDSWPMWHGFRWVVYLFRNSSIRYPFCSRPFYSFFSFIFAGSGAYSWARGFHLWIIDELFGLMSNRFDSRLISRLNIYIYIYRMRLAQSVCVSACVSDYMSAVGLRQQFGGFDVPSFECWTNDVFRVFFFFHFLHSNRFRCVSDERHRKMKWQKSVQLLVLSPKYPTERYELSLNCFALVSRMFQFDFRFAAFGFPLILSLFAK